tara:strand:- start:3471 stop:3890 length:420 start_codon:yes stop_codon:yes gene_type:complete
MELFLFLLSFVSGGVVLTVAYIYHTTSQTKDKQDRLVSYQQNLQTIQADQFNKYKTELESVYKKLSIIEEEMKNDGYANLSTQRKLQKTAELRIKMLEDEMNKNRNMINGNMDRSMGEIQKLIAWKNTVSEDPNVISRY